MNKIQKSYKSTLIITVILALFLILAVFGIVLYSAINTMVEEQLGVTAQGVAVATSLIIMENVEEYEEFLQTRDADSNYYKKMQSYFSYIKENSNIKFIFTEMLIDSETIEYLLDSEPIGSPEYSPIGSTGPNDWKREIVYNTQLPAKFKLFDHPIWGKIIPAYAPILNRDGEFLGVLGINIDSNELFEKLAYLLVLMVTTIAILVGVIVILLMKYSDAILEPIIKDKLTGAYNKRSFDGFLRTEMKYSMKSGNDLSLIMFDLDRFKEVNDTHGHLFGDIVLQSISQIIKDALRKTDYFVRYGGDEFIIVLTDTNLENGIEVAERIRKTVADSPVYDKEKNEHVKITISLGIAQAAGPSFVPGDLVDNADKALYIAKKDRNKVVAFK